MATVDEGQDFSVIVDFAHTPDSFEKLFKDIRPVVKGKLIVLFGSAGRRDEAKRAVQGRLAGKYADEVVVTEEDDRDMDGQQIMEQIAAGAAEAGKVQNKTYFLYTTVPRRLRLLSLARHRPTTRYCYWVKDTKNHRAERPTGRRTPSFAAGRYQPRTRSHGPVG